MRQPYWKPQHEVFIRCMLQHGDPAKAYRAAYPKANPASARVGGHRLYNYPHIRQRVEPIIKERRAEVHKRALEEGAERERLQNERRMEMRRTLYNVVMRKLKRKRNFTVNGQTITIDDNPSVNTILNAMVLDIRLEAGYDNWPVIERRFARIMTSLLPREKREQTVTNSEANPVEAIAPADHSQTALLQNKPPIPLKGEYVMVRSPFRGIGGKDGPDAIIAKRVQSVTISERPPVPLKGEYIIVRSPFRGIGGKRPNAGVCEKRVQPSDSEFVNANEKTLFRKQPVTISPTNPVQATNSPLEGGRQCAALTGGCNITWTENAHIAQTSPSAPFKGGIDVVAKWVQPVTISPTNPTHTHRARNLKKAPIHCAVTKPATCYSLINGAPSGVRG